MRDCRIIGGVIAPLRSMADLGAFDAVVVLHPWLYCWDCGYRLGMGETVDGATLYACYHCRTVCDTRWVS